MSDTDPQRAKPVVIRASGRFSLPDFKEIWEYRDLLGVLIVRDIRLRYKQAALGVAWVVLQPIIAAALFAVVFGKFGKLPSDGVPYLLFAFLGVVGWQILQAGLTKAVPSLVTNANMVSKVYFPRILMPVSSSLGVLLDVAVSFVLVAILMVIYHVPPTLNLLVLPFAIVFLFLISIGVGLLLSALSVANRDFIQGLPFFLQIWMYASPVAYSGKLVPEHLQWLYGLNPVVLGVEAVRWSIVGKPNISLPILMSSLSSGILILLGGMIVFRSSERKFADVI